MQVANAAEGVVAFIAALLAVAAKLVDVEIVAHIEAALEPAMSADVQVRIAGIDAAGTGAAPQANDMRNGYCESHFRCNTSAVSLRSHGSWR